MKYPILAALALGTAFVPASAHAQQAPAITQTIAGTRLDINATGEVTRVPDVAIITAGVVTRSATASGAIQQAATRMARVREALRQAGIADRDIQTSNISLEPQYTYANNQPPKLNGYAATNQLSIRFRDIENTGKILDALVAQGANQIGGPTLEVSKPEEALDEARTRALAAARARAELYARATGKRVGRILSISESGSIMNGLPRPMMAQARMVSTAIDPGEQNLSVTLSVSFELE